MNQLQTLEPTTPTPIAVKHSYQGTAPNGNFKQIQKAIDDLKRERASQLQLNRHAKLSNEQSQAYAEISEHHAAESLRHSQTADRLAKSMPDSGAIVMVSVGVSFLFTLVAVHLSILTLGNSHAPKSPQSGFQQQQLINRWQ